MDDSGTWQQIKGTCSTKTSFSANLSHLILGLTFHIIQRRTNFVKNIDDGTLPQN